MKKSSNSVFTTVSTQGGLFPPEFLQRICDLDKSITGLLPADYHLPEHRRISEEANRAWSVLQGDWKAFRKKVDAVDNDDPATGLTRDQWMLPLFDQLGYGRLKKAGSSQIDGKDYPVSHFWEHSPIHLVGWNLDLDKRATGVAGAARFAPHGMVQEFLNRSEDHLWGFVSNGRQLRILRDNLSMTRQSYVEFDLIAMMDGELYSDFVLLWLLCHSSRVEVLPDEDGKPRTPQACWLERWSREAETQGSRLLDHLREGVEDSIRIFGSGFLAQPANQTLREKLRSGELDKQDYYRQLLRLVYRLIFLFVAEDRDLLHLPATDANRKKLYFDHYSTQRIRRMAENKRGTQHRDLWESLKLLFGWLCTNDGCAQLGLTPLGGFLFSDETMPDLAEARLANSDLLHAIRSLAITNADGLRRPVDYRNLGAEELGSIYESLLEMHPDLNLDAATFKLDVAAGNERKSTGSYYTPKPLVNCLLDSALDPVVSARLKEASKQSALEAKRKDNSPKENNDQRERFTGNRQSAMEQALLSLRVCDPACGSGHFLIGAAHRIAKHLASVRSGDAEPSPEATRHALRDVITHCVYGVDINPMSVELCKVSLWMEAMEPGKPLGFLDHHIKCGNSLLGTTPALLSRGIPDDAFNPIEGDDKTICSALKKRNKEEREGKGTFDDLFVHAEATWSYEHAFEDAIHELEDIDDDSIQSLEKKQLAYEQFLHSTSYTGGKRLHDAWCAAFVQPKVKPEGDTQSEPGSGNQKSEIGNRQCHITQQLIREMQTDPNRCPKAQQELIDRLAAQYKFFHWHIEFPDVFQPLESFAEKDSKGWNGGFDCMLGNPPWDRVALEELEYFSAKDPTVLAAPTTAKRKKVISNLKNSSPELYNEFLHAKRHADATGAFFSNCGQYPLGACGRLNTYPLFAEICLRLLNKCGRMGVVVQTGIATDAPMASFWEHLINERLLVLLLDFENRKPIFPHVHRELKFCLLTLTSSSRPEGSKVDVGYWLINPEEVSDPEKVYSLPVDGLEIVSPNTKQPILARRSRDGLLVNQIYTNSNVMWNNKQKSGVAKAFVAMTSASYSQHCVREVDLSDESLEFDSNWRVNVSKKDYYPLIEAKQIYQYNISYATYDGVSEKDVASGNPVALSSFNSLPKPRFWAQANIVRGFWDSKGSEISWSLAYRDVTNVNNERTAIATVLPAIGFLQPLNGIRCHNSQDACFVLAATNSFCCDYVARLRFSGRHLNVTTFNQLPVPRRSNDLLCTRRVLELSFTAECLAPFAASLDYHGSPFVWDEERRFEIRCELDAAFFHLYGIDNDDDVDYIMETFPIVKRKDEKQYGTYRTKNRILEIYREMARCMAASDDSTFQVSSFKSHLNPPPGPPVDADGNFIPAEQWHTLDPVRISHIHPPKEEK